MPEKLPGGNIQAVSKSRKGLSEANVSQNISGDISKKFENLSSERIPTVSCLFIHPACTLCRSHAAVAVKAEIPFLHARSCFHCDVKACKDWAAEHSRGIWFQVIDKKGDTLEYPKVVQTLPFWDSANTYFFNDDYTLNCAGEYTDQGGGKVTHSSDATSEMTLHFAFFAKHAVHALCLNHDAALRYSGAHSLMYGCTFS